MQKVCGSFVLVLVFAIFFQPVSDQQSPLAENGFEAERDLKFVYVSGQNNLNMVTFGNSDQQKLVTLKDSDLKTFAKSLIGLKSAFFVSPAPFGDYIACFVISEKIGGDEEKLIVVDTTGNNLVELGAYKIEFKTEKKPGSVGVAARNFVLVRNFKMPQWSPDGKEILVASREGLFKVEVATRQNIKLGQTKNVKDAVWNRDGSVIYFTEGEDLFSINAIGTDEKKMPKPEGHWKEKANLVLLSDGGKLIFSNGFRIYALDLATGAYSELIDCKEGIYAIEVVSNSERVVCSIGTVDYFELIVFDMQTAKRHRLKKWNASGADLVSPSVSPSGESVLFSMRELNDDQQIYLTDIEGKKIFQMTKDGGNTYPCFLP